MVEARKCPKNGLDLPSTRRATVIFYLKSTQLHVSPFLVQHRRRLRPAGQNPPQHAAEREEASSRNYRFINSFCKKQTCCYAQVKDLRKILKAQAQGLASHPRRKCSVIRCSSTPSYNTLPRFHLPLPESCFHTESVPVHVPLFLSRRFMCRRQA